MGLTKIEEFALDGVNEFALVSRLGFGDGIVHVELARVPANRRLCALQFENATVTSLDLDHEGPLTFPLDLIGFDCYAAPAKRWRFVLNCSEIELVWESDWPVRQML